MRAGAIRERVRCVPVLGPALAWVYRRLRRPARFPGSARYWDERYAEGGTSGDGSYGALAAFKAEVLNAFVAERGVRSVLEIGCGDGHQLSLARYPRYLGFDVSPTAVALCTRRFAGDATKAFRLLADDAGETADLALSLDVVYHLIEDQAFDRHMRRLFAAGERFVVVYASDFEARTAPHVRHRAFTRWIAEHEPGWRLAAHVPNRHPYAGDNATGSLASFYLYERRPPAPA